MSQAGFERVAQKQRTRAALLTAAREMMQEGRALSVADVADRAGISRATAYRYFSQPEGMAEEAVLDAIAVAFERVDLEAAVTGDDAAARAGDDAADRAGDGAAARAGDDAADRAGDDAADRAGDDAADRAATVVSRVLAMVLENEAMFRCYLGLVVGNAGAKRGGRRIGWLRKALAPLEGRVAETELERLVAALSLACGIEAIITWKDVCGLDAAAIDRTARWTARALVTAAVEAAGAGTAPSPG